MPVLSVSWTTHQVSQSCTLWSIAACSPAPESLHDHCNGMVKVQRYQAATCHELRSHSPCHCLQVHCTCGITHDDGCELIECETPGCKIWQHTACRGVNSQTVTFLCSFCLPDTSDKHAESRPPSAAAAAAALSPGPVLQNPTAKPSTPLIRPTPCGLHGTPAGIISRLGDQTGGQSGAIPKATPHSTPGARKTTPRIRLDMNASPHPMPTPFAAASVQQNSGNGHAPLQQQQSAVSPTAEDADVLTDQPRGLPTCMSPQASALGRDTSSISRQPGSRKTSQSNQDRPAQSDLAETSPASGAESHDAASADAGDEDITSQRADSPMAGSAPDPESNCSTPQKQSVSASRDPHANSMQSSPQAADTRPDDDDHADSQAHRPSENADEDEAPSPAESSDDDVPLMRRSRGGAGRRSSLASPPDEPRLPSTSPPMSTLPSSGRREHDQGAAEPPSKGPGNADDDAADTMVAELDDASASPARSQMHASETGHASSPTRDIGAEAPVGCPTRLQPEVPSSEPLVDIPMELGTPRGQSGNLGQKSTCASPMGASMSPEPSRAHKSPSPPGSRGFSLTKPPHSPFAIKAFPSSRSKVRRCLPRRAHARNQGTLHPIHLA